MMTSNHNQKHFDIKVTVVYKPSHGCYGLEMKYKNNHGELFCFGLDDWDTDLVEITKLAKIREIELQEKG